MKTHPIRMALAAILLAFIAPWVTASAQPTNNSTDQNTALSDQQVEQVNTLIHDYILNNPEILIEAGQVLQKKQAEAEQNAAMTAIAANKDALFHQKDSPVIGNPKGTDFIVEFYDYQCGHCKDMTPTITAVLKENTHAKLILKELPIFGENSEFAAKASLAVYQIAPQSFTEFHKQLLNIEGPLSEEKVLDVATQLKINHTELTQAMANSATEQELKNNFQLAQKIGIQGTPSFVLANDKLTEFKFIPGATSKENLLKLLGELQ